MLAGGVQFRAATNQNYCLKYKDLKVTKLFVECTIRAPLGGIAERLKGVDNGEQSTILSVFYG
jgi:hypothetical protein